MLGFVPSDSDKLKNPAFMKARLSREADNSDDRRIQDEKQEDDKDPKEGFWWLAIVLS